MSTPPRRSWASADELLEDWADISARAAPARMVRSRRISLAAAAVSGLSLAVLVIVGLAVVGLANRPGPGAPVGSGPRIVALPTAPSPLPLPPGAVRGCRAALAEGVLAGDSHDAEVAWLVGRDGARQEILWPFGYSARFDPGLELIAPNGAVIARAGDRLELGGGVGDTGRFSVDCDSIVVVSATPSPEPAPTATPQPAAGPATWRLAPGETPTADSPSINVLLTERECANGASPEGRILEPVIEYRPDTIVITISVIKSPGDCPSNPEFPLTVELGQSLGNRALVDGTEAAIRWPVADD